MLYVGIALGREFKIPDRFVGLLNHIPTTEFVFCTPGVLFFRYTVWVVLLPWKWQRRAAVDIIFPVG